MRHEIWIYVMDFTFKTLVRWHLCITKNNVEFMVDAATRAMEWARAHMVHSGRYEVHVLLLTPEQREAITPLLSSVINSIPPTGNCTQLSMTTLKPPTDQQRQILNFKRARLTDEETAGKMNMTPYAVVKSLYRARISYGARSTTELIDLLVAADLL